MTNNFIQAIAEAVGKKHDLIAKDGKVHQVNHPDLTEKHGFKVGDKIASSDLDDLTEAGYRVKEL